MLATISKGQHRSAYDIDSRGSEMQKLLKIAMSTALANISIDAFDSLDKVEVLATQCIDQLTAHAWFSESKEIEDKVANMSLESGIMSEYTRMVLVENESANQISESPAVNKLPPKTSKKILLQKMGVGFGNLTATADNTRPGVEEPKMPEAAKVFLRAASGCCGKMWIRCCCMCCIQCCSKMNNQCAIVLTQCCTALAWFGCFECCTAICCSGSDGS